MDYVGIFCVGVIAGTTITSCFAANKITDRDRENESLRKTIQDLEKEKQIKITPRIRVVQREIKKKIEVPYNKPKRSMDPIILDDDIKLDELMDQINEGR